MIDLVNAGTDTVKSIKHAHEFHIGAPSQTVVAMALFIHDIHSLRMEAAKGFYFMAGFYWDRDDATRAWSHRVFDTIGRMPTRGQAETYSAVHHYLRGVIANASPGALAVMTCMKANAIDDFYPTVQSCGRAGD